MHNQETDEGTEQDDFSNMFAQFKQQHPQADMNKLMQTMGGQGGMKMPQMPGMGGAGMSDMSKMMGGMQMPQMPAMPQGGGNSITVNGKPATQAEFDAFTKQHNVVPGQMPGGQKLTPGQMPSLPGGMKTPQLGGSPQDMVNNMMKGMNESEELGHIKHLAGMHDQHTDEDMMDPQDMMKGMMGQMGGMQMPSMPQGGTNSRSSSYTINGKPVSKAEYDQFMVQHPELAKAQQLQNKPHISWDPAVRQQRSGGTRRVAGDDMMESELTAMLKIAGLR
jgi:hypothetical protein